MKGLSNVWVAPSSITIAGCKTWCRLGCRVFVHLGLQGVVDLNEFAKDLSTEMQKYH